MGVSSDERDGHLPELSLIPSCGCIHEEERLSDIWDRADHGGRWSIILAFVLYDKDGIVWLLNASWIVLSVSGLLGWLPILTFQKRGGVAKGKSYTETTVLVDSGIYGVVRHPQYVAGVLMNVAMPMISQHWLVAALGAIAAAIYHRSAALEERDSIAKFGDWIQLPGCWQTVETGSR